MSLTPEQKAARGALLLGRGWFEKGRDDHALPHLQKARLLYRNSAKGNALLFAFFVRNNKTYLFFTANYSMQIYRQFLTPQNFFSCIFENCLVLNTKGKKYVW